MSDSTNTSGFNDFWAHEGGVTEIARGANLGSTGWADLTEYEFDLQFTSSLIEVSVDGNVELSITPGDVSGISSFDDGSFAFYNFSQSQMLYSAIEQAPSTVPEGGSSAAFLALGLLALARKRRRFSR